MIGHVVPRRIVTHTDDVVVVWHVNADGMNTGAWIVPTAEAFGDRTAARRLVDLCVDRLVIGWEPSFDLLLELEAAAGTSRRWVGMAIPDALEEIGEIRTACEKRVDEQRAENASITPLEWRIDLPDPLPATEEEMHRRANIRPPSFEPGVAADVLLTCRVVRWTVRRWQETAVALERRTYLREEFGAPEVLPPRWLRAMTEAMADHPAMRRRRGSGVA